MQVNGLYCYIIIDILFAKKYPFLFWMENACAVNNCIIDSVSKLWMNLVPIPGSSEVMSYEIMMLFMYISVCLVSVTFVWSIAQGAEAVISISSVVEKASLLFTIWSLVSQFIFDIWNLSLGSEFQELLLSPPQWAFGSILMGWLVGQNRNVTDATAQILMVVSNMQYFICIINSCF